MAVMKVGAVSLDRVEELRLPNKIADLTEDSTLIEANRHWLAPHFLDEDDGFDLVFHSWIFEIEGRVVLVDPCNGNGRPHQWPQFDNLDIPYIERIAETGYRPEDIDFVVCTHLHHDHCGWNTRLRAGKWVPTFPNARYIMRRLEYERWGSSRGDYTRFELNDGTFERSVQPVVEAGLADLISGDHDLLPGLTARPAPGHTIGHQMLHLVSGGEHALFCGDSFHHPLQLVDTANAFGGSDDMEKSAATRRLLAQLSADLGALLIAAHLPAPYGIRASRDGNGYRFRAAGALPA